MDQTKKVEVYQSKSKLIKLLVYSIIFLIAGLWIIIKQPEVRNAFFNNPVLKALAGYGGTLLGLCGVYFCSKSLLNKSPALIIDENGIMYNSGIYSSGLIPWTNISGVYETSLHVPMNSNQTFVTVQLNDPEAYISSEPNVIKRKLLSLNEKNYGSPIHISTNSLKIKHVELLTLMQEAFKNYQA